MSDWQIKPRGYEQTAIIESRGAVIAEVYTVREPGDQHDAARLIAAAPDLLAHLTRLIAAIDRLPGNNPLDGLADEARAAIARATGQ